MTEFGMPTLVELPSLEENARLAAALVWYGDKRSLREWGLCGPGCGGAASRPGYALWIAQKEE